MDKHARRPAQNKVIQRRAKDPDDELELIIVQSMLLTGFDSPPLQTIYADKPMRGAALMQALARVNRTFRNKQDGLLVGYAPLTEERKARGETVPPDVELYLKSLTASAIEAGGVTDIYAAAGIGRPDLSHLDEAFIARMQEQRNPHLAIEALRRLVEQEMRTVTKHNIVKQKSFAERLEDLMRKYTNENLTTAQIIAELVALAKEVSAEANRGATFTPSLNTDELAFYDAVAQNESAVTGMGITVLADIARDLVRTLRRDVTSDWVARDDVRAKIAHHQATAGQARLPSRRRGRRDQASSTRWKPLPTIGPQKPNRAITTNSAVRFTRWCKSIQLPFSHGNPAHVTMA